MREPSLYATTLQLFLITLGTHRYYHKSWQHVLKTFWKWSHSSVSVTIILEFTTLLPFMKLRFLDSCGIALKNYEDCKTLMGFQQRRHHRVVEEAFF